MLRPWIVVVVAAGCGGDQLAPSAHVATATPAQLITSDDAADDLTITVDYDDGDGDLGGGTVEVHDCRADALVTELPIPEIAPMGIAGTTHITGTLELHVNDIGTVTSGALPATCRDLGVAEIAAGTVVFCVVLADAKGHRGNGDCTVAIALTE